jgi:thiamine transport system ATP-binding protein
MLAVLDATVRFSDQLALDAVSLSVADGEVVAVLGPSGSGKTTLLRAVAGLQALDSGSITWDGADLAGVPTHRRNFCLMFQDFALFPHLDVAGNVAFGLRMQGVPAEERTRRTTEALERVELPGFEGRPIATLSGGETQRVALARALAPGPRMLLLDEPLGSLDRALRERLSAELRTLLKNLETTALYVTHDQAEAFALADRVVVLDRGRVLQIGTPEAVWSQPASEAVARFLGLHNLLPATVEGPWATTPIGVVPAPENTHDGPVRLVIRPEAFSIDHRGTVEGTVRSRLFRGTDYLVCVDAGGAVIEALLRDSPDPGAKVRLAVDPGGVSVLQPPRATRREPT